MSKFSLISLTGKDYRIEDGKLQIENVIDKDYDSACWNKLIKESPSFCRGFQKANQLADFIENLPVLDEKNLEINESPRKRKLDLLLANSCCPPYVSALNGVVEGVVNKIVPVYWEDGIGYHSKDITEIHILLSNPTAFSPREDWGYQLKSGFYQIRGKEFFSVSLHSIVDYDFLD